MAKFNEKLQELDIKPSKLSGGINTLISSYRKKLVQYEQNNDETLKEELEDLDEKITTKIQNWFDNKNGKPVEKKQTQPKEPKPKVVKKVVVENDDDDVEDDERDDDNNKDAEAEAQRLKDKQERDERVLYALQQKEQLRIQLEKDNQEMAKIEQKKKRNKSVWILAGLVAVVTLGAVILKEK